jgi:hypothetical protein
MHIVLNKGFSNNLLNLRKKIELANRDKYYPSSLFASRRKSQQEELLDLYVQIEKETPCITRTDIMMRTKRVPDTSFAVFFDNYVIVDSHAYPIHTVKVNEYDLCPNYGRNPLCDDCEFPYLKTGKSKRKYIIIGDEMYDIKKSYWGKKHLQRAE